MSNTVKRTIKIVTEQHVLQGRDSGVEGFPLRAWSIKILLLNDRNEEIPADIFDKVTYKLHESFGERATQVIKQPPFAISEEGWGEFDMQIILTAKEKGGDHPVVHDLNFQKERYEKKEQIVGCELGYVTHTDRWTDIKLQSWKNPKPAFIEILRESGPVPGDENGRKKGDDLAKKKKRANKGVNMDELAENMQRLGEDDLLSVVQMISDGKSSESYTKNDVEAGEFHVDLYTLPDDLLQSLWNFCEGKV